jgi:hypothetical protein
MCPLPKTACHVDAAIAYFGRDGAKLLPLCAGHRLVVDMSAATVRAGGTDPREAEKLIDRGVHCGYDDFAIPCELCNSLPNPLVIPIATLMSDALRSSLVTGAVFAFDDTVEIGTWETYIAMNC